MTAQEKFSALVAFIRRYDDIAVAFSGGTKSSLLVCAAQEAQGNRIWLLTANTPFFTKEELYRVHEVLDEYKVHSERVAMPELLDLPDVQKPEDRCAACGKAVSERLAGVARGIGAAVLLTGQAEESLTSGCRFSGGDLPVKVVSPFVELGYQRKDIEEMLAAIGRGYYSKPANDCLACRFLQADTLTAAALDFVEEAEKYIRRYTRNHMKVCIDGTGAIVYSVDALAEKEMEDTRRELLGSGKGLGITKVEFLGIQHLEEYGQ